MATSDTPSTSAEVPDWARCPICYESFSADNPTLDANLLTPIGGACQHNVCRGCMLGWVASTIEKHHGRRIINIKCMVCNKPNQFKADNLVPNVTLCNVLKFTTLGSNPGSQEQQRLEQAEQGESHIQPDQPQQEEATSTNGEEREGSIVSNSNQEHPAVASQQETNGTLLDQSDEDIGRITRSWMTSVTALMNSGNNREQASTDVSLSIQEFLQASILPATNPTAHSTAANSTNNDERPTKRDRPEEDATDGPAKNVRYNGDEPQGGEEALQLEREHEASLLAEDSFTRTEDGEECLVVEAVSERATTEEQDPSSSSESPSAQENTIVETAAEASTATERDDQNSSSSESCISEQTGQRKRNGTGDEDNGPSTPSTLVPAGSCTRIYGDRVLFERIGIRKGLGGSIHLGLELFPFYKKIRRFFKNRGIGHEGHVKALAVEYRRNPRGPKWAGQENASFRICPLFLDEPFAVFMEREDNALHFGWEYCGQYKLTGTGPLSVSASKIYKYHKEKVVKDICYSLRTPNGMWCPTVRHWRQMITNATRSKDGNSLAKRAKELNFDEQMPDADLAAVIVELDEFYEEKTTQFVEYWEGLYSHLLEYQKAVLVSQCNGSGVRRQAGEKCATAADWYKYLDDRGLGNM